CREARGRGHHHDPEHDDEWKRESVHAALLAKAAWTVLRGRPGMKGPTVRRRRPSLPVVKLEVPMAPAPWIVSDELWGRIEPLLPRVERRFRYPGRKRLPDRQALQGILFVLYTGIAWRHLPPELGFGGGSTCHRRMDEWQRAGVWQRLHELLLA